MPRQRSRLLLVFLAGMVAIGLLALAWAVGSGPSEAQQDSMHNCPQPGRWAIPVWDGEDGTDAGEAFASCGEEAVAVAYSIDPGTQMWSRWFADRPELNNLQTLNDMQGVIALAAAGAPAPPTLTLPERIAFTSYRDDNDEIYVMDADGTNQTNLTNNPASDSIPAWSPDGSKIAFTSSRDGNLEIYVMDADGTNQTRLTDNPAEDAFPAWSPDGQKIAFRSNRDDPDPEGCLPPTAEDICNTEIYVMNADGSDQTRLTTNPAWDEQPAWSPDGTKIAFDSDRGAPTHEWDIYVMDADGTNPTRLTSSPRSSVDPAWSPDGSKIAFASGRDDNWEIYVMNADGTNQTRLTDNPADDLVPTWSPDGSKIAFQSDRDGNDDIYVMNADGTKPSRLTDDLAADTFPHWQPLGPAEGEMHNCPQPGKWAISVWSGQDGTDASEALATCGADAVTAAYALDPQTQAWSRWFPGRPAISNLSTVDDMQGLIVLGGAEAPASPTPPGGDVFLYSRFVPPVVYSDGSSTTTLEVHTTGQGIEAVYLESGSVSFGQLYDDGSHGDHTAGDGVYTLSGITHPAPTLLWGTFSTYGFEARIVRAGGLEERHSLATLGVVLPGLSYPAVQLDAKTSATTHAIFIVDDAGEIFPGFPITEVLCGKTNFIPYEKVYAHFADAFDFLLVMPSGNLYDPVEFAQRENVPYFVLAKNEVQNIGLALFDDTATFGSDGRLMGAVYHSFGSPAIMEHELGHAWGVNYGSSLGLVSTSGEGGVNLSHWDEASDINGLMQEFVFADDVVGHLVDNGDGTYRIVPQAPDSEAFAPLELYLMGLIPPEEVPPVHRLIDPDYSDPNRVTAEQVETITIQQLMAAEGGPRIPDHTASPKTFTAAFIAVSDRSFSQAEYDFFSAMAEYLASTAAAKEYVAPFYAATGGRATLDTRLPSPAP